MFPPGRGPLDIKITEFEVEHEDVYHWKNFYKWVYDWVQREGYKSYAANDDKPEDLYWEQTLANGNKNYHMWWRVHRVPYKNSYYEYFIKINFQGLNFTSTEVMVDGHKMKTNKGDGIIRVRAVLRLDYKGKWDKHPFLKHFHWVFRERIFKKNIEAAKKDLYKTAYRLQADIKQYLNLRIPFDRPKMFHRVKGV